MWRCCCIFYKIRKGLFLFCLTYTPTGYNICVHRGGITMSCCEPKHKHVPRSDVELKQLKNRIHRIIGQLNGIESMLEDNRYCGDVLIQIAAVEKALQSFGYTILQEHLETCVTEDVKEGNTDIMEEVMNLVKRLK